MVIKKQEGPTKEEKLEMMQSALMDEKRANQLLDDCLCLSEKEILAIELENKKQKVLVQK